MQSQAGRPRARGWKKPGKRWEAARRQVEQQRSRAKGKATYRPYNSNRRAEQGLGRAGSKSTCFGECLEQRQEVGSQYTVDTV